MDSYEELWWSLPESARARFERAVTFIVYSVARGNRQYVLALVATAKARHVAADPVAAAVLWRLKEEVSGDE